MKPVLNFDGVPLPEARQRDWQYADSIGLRPSQIRFIDGEPLAVHKDGSGIYGPCPRSPFGAEPRPSTWPELPDL